MQLIQLSTTIAAPTERCFLLSLSLDLHKASSGKTREEIVDGVRSGIIGPQQTVTWRARHFGLWLTHAATISAYDRPTHFRDEMTRGMFKTFVHDHHFKTLPDGTTLMRDDVRFAAPLGLLGRLAESLVLRLYLTRFLRERNRVIQTTAEGPEEIWAIYVK